MRSRNSKGPCPGWWRRYWFLLPTIAFVSFAVWALLSVPKEPGTGLVPAGGEETASPRRESADEGGLGEVPGPDMELPVYSPARAPGPPRSRLRGARPREMKGADVELESGLKIPCIFRDDCEGSGTDSTGGDALEEQGLKIPSVFEKR